MVALLGGPWPHLQGAEGLSWSQGAESPDVTASPEMGSAWAVPDSAMPLSFGTSCHLLIGSAGDAAHLEHSA